VRSPRASRFKSQSHSDALPAPSPHIIVRLTPAFLGFQLWREAFQPPKTKVYRLWAIIVATNRHPIRINSQVATLRGILYKFPLSLDLQLNVYQCHGCDRQRKCETRGCNAAGKVRAVHISRWLMSECDRLVADALKDSVTELRKDEGTRVSQCVHAGLSRCRGC
jgi:hypothetical protein